MTIAAHRPLRSRPAPATARLSRLVRQAVAETALDLRGRVVLTEAATGAYAVTPVLAAAGGADRVLAFTRATRHGTVAEVAQQTRALADAVGVGDRIEVVTTLDDAVLATVDLVTNSGHLRPLDRRLLERLRPGAAISLMYEAWELATRPGDVDLRAVVAYGHRVAGTNERHRAVDVFAYLAPMAMSVLLQAQVAVYRSAVGVVCDNEFEPALVRGLVGCGARVRAASTVAGLGAEPLDAIVVALRPRGEPVVSAAEVDTLARAHPGAVLVQLWGDLDRDALAAAGVPVAPAIAPGPGHMGVLPSAIGPEPVVRLQAGGLKVGQVLLTAAPTREELTYVDLL